MTNSNFPGKWYLIEQKTFFIQRDHYEKRFLEAKETNPDILGGGLRNPYQLKNAIKRWDSFFAYITWAK